MIELDSTVGFLVQCGTLLVVGALLTPLVRLFRFRRRVPMIVNPRASSLWALCAVGAGWILVVVLFLATHGDALIESPNSQYASPPGPEDALGQFVVALIAVGPVLIVIKGRREPLASAGASANNLGRSLLVSIPLVSALVVWCFLVLQRCDASAYLRSLSVWALVQFAIVGFAEEFAFRGYLQTRLICWLGDSRGWVLASVLMAMAHVGHRIAISRMSLGEALVSSASLIPISLFLGLVMLRTQSIVAPGLLHTTINWLDL